MADRNRELVPDNWSLVRERVLNQLNYIPAPSVVLSITNQATDVLDKPDPAKPRWGQSQGSTVGSAVNDGNTICHRLLGFRRLQWHLFHVGLLMVRMVVVVVVMLMITAIDQNQSVTYTCMCILFPSSLCFCVSMKWGGISLSTHPPPTPTLFFQLRSYSPCLSQVLVLYERTQEIWLLKSYSHNYNLAFGFGFCWVGVCDHIRAQQANPSSLGLDWNAYQIWQIIRNSF